METGSSGFGADQIYQTLFGDLNLRPQVRAVST